MELNETSAQRVNDVYSELAAITAADTNEIATAMTKTASIADSANMEFETTSAFLSQIIETTRESAETAGTAMKTIIARFQELKKDPSEIELVDGESVDANKIETALRSVGVALRDTEGQFRDLDDVFLDLASRWDSLDLNTQRYIATMAAGSRQQSRFIAMMQDYDRTMELVNAAYDSNGSSQKQFEKTQDSLESKLNELKNAWTEFSLGVANSDFIKGAVDALTKLLSIINKITESGGSFVGSLKKIGLVWGGLKLGKIASRGLFGALSKDKGIVSGFTSGIKDQFQTEFSGIQTFIKNIFSSKNFTVGDVGTISSQVATLKNSMGAYSTAAANAQKATQAVAEAQREFSVATQTAIAANEASQASLTNKANLSALAGTAAEKQAEANLKLKSASVAASEADKLLQEAQVGVIEAQKALGLNTQELNAISAAGTSDDALAIILSDEKTASKLKEALATGTYSKELGEELTLEALANQYKSKGIMNTIKMQVALSRSTAFQEAYNKALAEGATKQVAFDTAVNDVFSSLVGTVGIIGSLVALLALAIAMTVQAEKTLSLEGRLGSLQTASEGLTNALKDTKDAYDNLMSARDSYKELKNGFDGLTEGTLAWKEALSAANEQVLELITKYPDLTLALEKGEYGELVITEESWDGVLAEQKKQIQRLTNGSMVLNMAQEYEKLQDVTLPVTASEVIAKEERDLAILQRGTFLDKLTAFLTEPYVDNALSAPIKSNEPTESNNGKKTAADVKADINAKKIKSNQEEYDQALLDYQKELQRYSQNFVAANFDFSDYSFSDEVASSFTDAVSEQFAISAAEKIPTLLDTAKLGSSGIEFLDDAASELGYKNKTLASLTKKQLQELYADLTGVAVEEIPQELKKSKYALQQAIASLAIGEDLSKTYDVLFDDLRSLSSRSQKILAQLFAKNVDAFSEGAVAFSEALQDADIANNYEKWAEALGIEAKSANELITQIVQQMLEKAEQINSQIAQKMVLGDWYINADDLQRSKYEDTVSGWSQNEKQEALNIGENISVLGWEAEAKYWETIITSSNEAKDAVKDFISNIDFDNPITMAASFEKALNSENETVKKLAISFRNFSSSSIDAAHQMNYFLKSADFSDLEDSLEDFIKDNKRITGKNVEELADSNASLNQLLKNNIISIDGMALALTKISTGEWTISSLSNTVLASLKNWADFEDQIERTLALFEEFDPGYSEHTAIETVEDVQETITENLERGTINDSAMKNSIELLFGDDAFAEVNDLTGVSRDYKLQELLTQYSQTLQSLVDSGDFYPLWESFTKGQTARGEEIGSTGKNYIDDNMIFHAQSGTSDDYTVQKLPDGSIELLTKLDSETFAKKLAEDLDISVPMANAMVADMRATSTTIDEMFYENNLRSSYEGLLSGMEQGEDGKYLLSQQDLETLSGLYGYKGDTEGFQTRMQEEYGAEFEIYDLYSENGTLKQGEEFFKEYNKSQDIAAESTEGATSALDSFIESLREDSKYLTEVTGFDGKKTNVIDGMGNGESINYDEMVSSMENATGQAKENLQAQLTEAIQGAAEKGVDYLTTTYNGKEYQIPIDENTTAADVEAAIEQGMSQADTTAETNQLVTAIQEALTTMDAINIVASFPPEDEGVVNISNVITACQKYCEETPITEEVEIKADPASLANARTAIKNNLANIVAQVKVSVPGGSSGSSQRRISGYTKAEGTQSSKVTGTALGGELGPELHVSNGRATIIGEKGPELFHLSKGDIVYTAKETKEIFSKGNKKGLSFSAHAIGYGNHSTSDNYWYKKNKAISSSKTGSTSGNTSATSAVAEAEEAAEIWENTFDWLYNLTEDINEILRDREKLEREYDRILAKRNTTAKQLFDNVQDQLGVLETERQKQQEMYDKRAWEMQDYLSKNSDLAQYATYNWDDMTIEIDWDRINAVTDEDTGEAIEDYVAKLEDIQDEMDDAEDELMEIEDRIQEILDMGKEEYLDFENMVFEALQAQKQALIDNASEISEAIADTNSNLLSSLSDSISKMREDRELEEDRTSLEDQQKRLIYLQQDTSGGNALEILKLQQDIEDAQQSYTDKLIDRKIDELQQQNDEAAGQRERQIELAQEQLDHWSESQAKWEEIHALMGDGINSVGQIISDSELMKVLQDKEGVESLSSYSQMDWLKTLEEDVKAGLTWFAQDQQLEKIGKTSGTIKFTDSSGTEHTGTVNSDGSVTVRDDKNGGNWTYSQVFKNYDGTYRTFEENASFKKDPEPEPPKDDTPKEKEITIGGQIDAGSAYIYGDSAGGGRGYQYFSKDPIYTVLKEQNGYLLTRWYKLSSGYTGWFKKSDVKAYKTGGLADYTGPAWLDGTPSKPEIVLNAQDTKNFIALKNVLASLMSAPGAESATNNTSNGDNYYDINISVESVSSDYDVEQIANKVESLIVQDGLYRNVNSINRLK